MIQRLHLVFGGELTLACTTAFLTPGDLRLAGSSPFKAAACTVSRARTSASPTEPPAL